MSFSIKASANKPLSSSLRSPLELVVQSLQIYRAHFWALIGYSAWLILPFTGYFILSFFPEQNPFVHIGMTFFSVVEFVITFWIGIIFTLFVHWVIEKHPFTPEELSGTSAKLLHPSARVFFLYILLVLAGFLLLVLPGFIALVFLAFAQTAVILDGKYGMQAIRFSISLVKGRFLSMVYRLVGGPILIGFLYSVVTALLLILCGSLSGSTPSELIQIAILPAWMIYLQSVVQIFAIPLLATYMTILYKEVTISPTKPVETP